MSKSKGDSKDGAPLKAVPLPPLPKCDDKDRNKWANDYDKVESELLKTHVSTPNAQTTTLGLRLLPANFDRTIPSRDPESSIVTSSKPTGGFRRAKTTEPEEISKLGRVSPIAAHSPGRSVHRRPGSAGAEASQNVTSTLSGVEGKCSSVVEAAQTLLTLLNPPVQFRTSFNIDRRHVDLAWLMKISHHDQPPANMATLETIREDMFINPSARDEKAALNSPRSAIVLLRNGVSVEDLQVKPISAFSGPAVTQEGALSAQKHYDNRRKATLNSLRDEYRLFCGGLSLLDVVEQFIAFRDKEGKEIRSTLIQKSREKQHQQQKMSKQRLEKQMEFIDETKHRLAESELRRVRSEDEAKNRLEQKRSRTHEQSVHAVQRMEELRESTNHLNLEFLKKMERRKAELARKEQVREEQLAAKRERHRHEMEKKQRQRDARIAQKRAAQQAELDKQREDFMQKEEEARIRREASEAEKADQKEKLLEQQVQASKRREEAREAARQHELGERDLAEKKRKAAEEKLQAYFKVRETQREEQHKIDRKKEMERAQKRQQAEEQSETRKQEILAKMSQHDQMLYETRHRQLEVDAQNAELEHFEQEDKGFYVQRKARAVEFQKLVAIGDISRKKEKAEVIEHQRRQLLEATLADREAARLHQEAFRQHVESRLSQL